MTIALGEMLVQRRGPDFRRDDKGTFLLMVISIFAPHEIQSGVKMALYKKNGITDKGFFILVFTVAFSLHSFALKPDSYRIVGYVMGSRSIDLSTIQAEKLTHINYAFAAIVDGEIAFRFRNQEQHDRLKLNIRKLTDLKKVNPDIKILISVGGWGNCAGFSDAALTGQTRSVFARSALKFMAEYGFDGVDLDWEYPGQIGGNEKFRPEDKENFTLMLKAIREEFDKAGSRALLTIATGADVEYFRWTNLGEAQKYLDFINIMAYDFYSGLSTISGHHSNLRKSDWATANNISAEIAVSRHLQAGVPAQKLVVGVPFYGRFWRCVPETNHGLYQQGSTVGSYKVYNDITDNYLNKNTFTRYWDPIAESPYLYSKDSAMVITYDDPESLTLKAKFVKKEKLGGIMFWEYAADKSGELLETLYQQLKN